MHMVLLSANATQRSTDTEAPTKEVPTTNAWSQMSSSRPRNDQGQRYESSSAAQGSCVLDSQCDKAMMPIVMAAPTHALGVGNLLFELCLRAP